ncbi:MAG TPA: DUF4836 family protein [Chitinophagaceae bacterium]
MKRNLFLLTLLGVVLFLVPSCGKKGGSTGLLVPDDAAIVVHINNASLSSKLSWAEIQQSNWYRELSKEAKDSTAQQLLSDPAVSGVDAKSDFVFFIKKQGKGSYLVIEGSLKDASAFEAFVKNNSKEFQPVKNGDITSLATTHDGVVSWNKSHFVYVADVPLPDMGSGFGKRSYGDDGEMKTHKFSADSLTYFGKETLTMSKDNMLDKDSRFASLVKDGSDIHLWMNSGEYYQSMMGPMMSMMGDMAALIKDNISAVSMNFDNGKITMDSKQYYGSKLNALFSKYQSKPVSADMVNRIPSQNIVGAFAMNYPPEGIKEFLKITNLEGMVNMVLSQTGYSVDEFIKANKGDMVVAVTDLEIKSKSDTLDMGNAQPYISSSRKPDMKVLFATAVNDKAAFEKLITLLWQQTKNSPMANTGITYKLENNWFAAGNSPEQVSQFLAGGNTKSPVADKLSGHPISFFIDIQKILQVAAADQKGDSAEAAVFDASLKTWQDVHAFGGEFKDKAFTFHAEVNLVDKSTNSLKQLNAYLDKVYMSMHDRKKSLDDMAGYPDSDTTTGRTDMKIEDIKTYK